MGEKIVNVKCDWCGKEIECPQNMMNSEKHSCAECFAKNVETMSEIAPGKLHVDFPREMAEEMLPPMFTAMLSETVFPKIWSEGKEDYKQMPKKELAQEMFDEGAMAMADFMMKMTAPKNAKAFKERLETKLKRFKPKDS